MKDKETKVGKATVAISEDTYKGVNMLKAKFSIKKGKALSWDEFFELLLNRERKKKNLASWSYTLGIFVAITFIFMFPLYVLAPLAAISMIPLYRILSKLIGNGLSIYYFTVTPGLNILFSHTRMINILLHYAIFSGEYTTPKTPPSP